jgi:hypothetical protein
MQRECIYVHARTYSYCLLKPDTTLIIYKYSVRTSQETHYDSITKTSRLMLFRETVAVYCEIHTKSKLYYDRRSVGQSVLEKAPIWGLRLDVYYCQAVAGFLM